MKKHRMSLTQRQSMTGRLFVLPFYLGFAFFFAFQIFQSVRFSFSDVLIDTQGIHATSVGFENFKYIFTVDSTYGTKLVSTLTQMLWQVPVIIVASLFIALILKSKFFGRTVVRGICFLPVILASGIVMSIVQTDTVSASIMNGNMVSSGSMVDANALEDLLVNMGLGSEITNFINMVYRSLFGMLWKSGMQMIIFLAGVQSIPPALYEASAIEGSTAWEDFWKITIPMIGPIIMLNIFYTIIETFVDSGNAIMNKVVTEFNNVNLDLAAAMAWVYFLIIAIVLGIIAFLFRKVNVKS